MKFANPPLVELIAELRWALPAVPVPQQGVMVPVQVATMNAHEEFFMRFAAKVSKDGFDSFERVVPSGFPTFPYQPVYRYRYGAPDMGTALYQLGAGLYSANITPPYDNWEKFKPVVARGLEAMLNSRPAVEANSPFSVCSLRYIDAFHEDLTEGMSSHQFATEVLGFQLDPPPVVKSLVASGNVVRPTAEFLIPLGDNLSMVLKVGDGNVNGNPALIVDTAVVFAAEVDARVDAAMSVLDNAHDIIRKVFLQMTEKFHLKMRPQ